MKTSVRIGLIVGGIAWLINTCTAFALGFCGPVVAVISGGIAGFLVAHREGQATKGDGAREGAIAGAIVGGWMLLSQMLAAVFNLVFVQQSGIELPFGTAPDPTAVSSLQALYYVSGLGVGACIGLVDIVVAALTGALAGYVGTASQPALSSDGYENGSI